MAFIDLHLHSSHSIDGQYSPTELIAMAAQRGLKTVAMADHNTCSGLAEATDAADAAGLELVPAVELDTSHQGGWFHVLGYWIKPDFPEFAVIENEIIRQEREQTDHKFQAFENLGLTVNRDAVLKLSKHGMIWGETVAEVVLDDPANKDNPLIKPYLPGGSRSDNPFLNFDSDFCAPGRPVHFPIKFIELGEAIEVIKRSGGLAVLAHPGRDVRENVDLLIDLSSQGLDGLEAYSSYHSPEQTAFYMRHGLHLNLALTCGSDFHGKTKPSIQIGSINCGDENTLMRILRARRHSGSREMFKRSESTGRR